MFSNHRMYYVPASVSCQLAIRNSRHAISFHCRAQQNLNPSNHEQTGKVSQLLIQKKKERGKKKPFAFLQALAPCWQGVQ